MFATRILALMAAGAAIVPAAVSAEPIAIKTISDDNAKIVRRSEVQTGDLDLASVSGKQALQARVNHAISEVCSREDIPDNFENGRCRQVARTDAKRQIADVLSRNSPRFAEAKPVPAPANTASGS